MPRKQGQPFELCALFRTTSQSGVSELFMGLFAIANTVCLWEPVQGISECQRIAYLLPMLAKLPPGEQRKCKSKK